MQLKSIKGLAFLSAWQLDFSTRNHIDVRLLAQNDDVETTFNARQLALSARCAPLR